MKSSSRYEMFQVTQERVLYAPISREAFHFKLFISNIEKDTSHLHFITSQNMIQMKSPLHVT